MSLAGQQFLVECGQNGNYTSFLPQKTTWGVYAKQTLYQWMALALQQIAAGQLLHRSNGRYKRINKRIHRLQRRFSDGHMNILQLLDGISYNLADYSR
jgi:hypothetical protein